MRIIKTLGMLIAPLLSLLGVDFALSSLIKKGKVKFSKESQEKYSEIETEYKKKLMAWAQKKGINVKRPSYREKEILKKELHALEGEALDRFVEYLRANRKRKDLMALAIGAELAKIINEHVKDKI